VRLSSSCQHKSSSGQLMQAAHALSDAPCCTVQDSCTVQRCAGTLPARTCQPVSRASASGQSILVLYDGQRHLLVLLNPPG
jgi:hypothetical protein